LPLERTSEKHIIHVIFVVSIEEIITRGKERRIVLDLISDQQIGIGTGVLGRR